MPKSLLSMLLVRSRIALAVGAVALAGAASSYLVSANASPTVTTEDPVYAGGDEVMIRAQGFAPNEPVTVTVAHADGSAEPGMGHESFAATADDTGFVMDYWTLRAGDAGSRQFVVRVSGATSGEAVSPVFTRAPRVEPSTRLAVFGQALTLNGRDFAAGETVTIQVKHADGTVEPDGAHEPFSVDAAADGTFVANWAGVIADSGPASLTVSISGSVSGATQTLPISRAAAMRTDKDDYMPSETAAVSGAGFMPGEVVEVQVQHLTGPLGGNGHQPFYVNADANGAITTSWFVDPDDSLGAKFVLSGKGATSGAFGEWIFTDAGSATLVISEVYGGGNNSGATFQNDYIQILNRSQTSQSLNGLSLQYASATGAGNLGIANQIFILPSAVTLAPGQYYLVKTAGGTTNGATFTADVTQTTGVINLSGSAGKIALVNSTVSLGCNTSANCSASALGSIIDLVGYGNANFFEGSAAAPTLTNSSAARRKNAGCTDTDDNASDFAAASLGLPANAVQPLLQTSPLNVCAAAVTPALSIADVSQSEGNAGTTTFSFTVSLSAPAGTGGVTFDIATADNTATTANGDYVAKSLTSQAIAAGSSSYTFDVTVNGDTAVEPNETFFVNVTNVVGATVSDAQAQGTVVNDDVPVVHIYEIQGAAHTSPLVGQAVATTPAVVTALRTVTGTRGFYIQDIAPDANDATSDGVFVFTGGSSNPSTLVSVGDLVSVRGTVTEFRPSAGSLSITEVALSTTNPSVTKLSGGNALPAAIVLGSTGRSIPSAVIEDDATNVETTGTFDPAQDGIDFWESLEGMLVQANDVVVVGPTSTNGSGATTNHDVPVLVDNGAAAGVRTTRGGIVIRATDYNPERIILNDLTTGGPQLPNANVGDSFPGVLTGIIDYSFNNPKLEVVTLPPFSSGGLAREASTAAAYGQLAVATFNVENLAPTDPQSKFDALAAAIVSNLKSPDVLAIEEIQDNNGTTNNGTVSAATTWSALIAAIASAGGPAYDYRQIDPVNGQDGGAPGGNIRQGFLFRTDRGLAFVDRPGASSVTANAVTGTGASTQLLYSPGRIDPTNPAFGSSRKPLAGEFTFRGRTVFVIANHFNSKGGDDALFGVTQPPVLTTEVQRMQQAAVEAAFVSQILAADPNANIVVLGDLNDFEFSNPVGVLKNAGLNALIETLPQEERYSYVFEGNSQALDHIMVSNGLFTRPFNYDIVHINSEFWDQISDHDPQVVRLTMNAAPTASAGGPYTVVLGQPVSLAGSGTDPEGDALTYAWDLDNNGSFETVGQNVTFSSASLSVGSYTVTVRVTDAGGLSTTASTTVQVIFNFAGFFAPVDPLPTLNRVKAGQAIPVKFSLGGNFGLNILASTTSMPVNCSTSSPIDDVESTVTAGNSSLQYDATSGRYIYVWKTDKAWAGQCRLLTVTTTDNVAHQALFTLK